MDIYYGQATGSSISVTTRARARGYYLLNVGAVDAANITSAFKADDVSTGATRTYNLSVTQGKYYIFALAYAQGSSVYVNPQYAINSASGLTGGELKRKSNGASDGTNRIFLDVYYGQASGTSISVTTRARARGYYLIPLN